MQKFVMEEGLRAENTIIKVMMIFIKGAILKNTLKKRLELFILYLYIIYYLFYIPEKRRRCYTIVKR